MFTSRDRWLALTYAAAIFVSAFLLFQIQPLVSKSILPWFGGSPAVWTTCLLFFQSLLFAGYAYAHWTSGWLKPRHQAVLHAVLIVIGIILLRVLPGDRWEPTGTERPIPQILLMLSVSIGVPFFVLSATGPLLQAWFARSFPGRVPYRLYALSNVGSLLALISYPFFFEPRFDLPRQALFWTCGFILYAGLCGYIAWQVRTVSERTVPGVELKPSPQFKTVADPAPTSKVKSKKRKRPSSRQAVIQTSLEPTPPRLWHYAFWLITAAFGSLVLMATTSHISVDIAVMPLLWVLPLAIYLLTFIIAFDRPAWYRRTPVAAIAIVSIYAAALAHHAHIVNGALYGLGTPGLVYSYLTSDAAQPARLNLSTSQFLFANFAALFAICMLCHGELVRTRPAPRYLTSFYLMIAAGGALGGLFATVIAPSILANYFEWDLSLLVACLVSIPIILWACIAFATRDRQHEWRPSRYARLAGVVLAVFLLSAFLLIDLSEFLFTRSKSVRWRARNFFGALLVQEQDPDDELMRRFLLIHGTTTHGAQFTHESRRREPSTYYSPNSGVGRAIEYYHRHLQPGKLRLGAVGLGTGTLAAYANPGDSITFYEINPIVIDVAEHGEWFTYLRDCRQRGARYDIRLGDARLTLCRELQSQGVHPYHLIVLDAFSGDSVPVHLLTTQAFELYLASLSGPTGADGKSDEAGAIAVHISSSYVDLEPVVRAAAVHCDLLPLRFSTLGDSAKGIYTADWIILTHNRAMASELAEFAIPFDVSKPPVLWTDSRSSLFEILR